MPTNCQLPLLSLACRSFHHVMQHPQHRHLRAAPGAKVPLRCTCPRARARLPAVIWDTLKAACETPDFDTAKVLIESAGIIVASSDMTICYDERGARPGAGRCRCCCLACMHAAHEPCTEEVQLCRSGPVYQPRVAAGASQQQATAQHTRQRVCREYMHALCPPSPLLASWAACAPPPPPLFLPDSP